MLSEEQRLIQCSLLEEVNILSDLTGRKLNVRYVTSREELKIHW